MVPTKKKQKSCESRTTSFDFFNSKRDIYFIIFKTYFMNPKSSPEFFEKKTLVPFTSVSLTIRGPYLRPKDQRPGVAKNRRRVHKTNLMNMNSKNIN